MKKTTVIALSALAVAGLGSLLLLQTYKIELIQTIVVNSIIQKAPDGYPSDQIRVAFVETLTRAQNENKEDDYLAELVIVSQRLEKIQRLDREEVDRLLTEFSALFPMSSKP